MNDMLSAADFAKLESLGILSNSRNVIAETAIKPNGPDRLINGEPTGYGYQKEDIEQFHRSKSAPKTSLVTNNAQELLKSGKSNLPPELLASFANEQINVDDEDEKFDKLLESMDANNPWAKIAAKVQHNVNPTPQPVVPPTGAPTNIDLTQLSQIIEEAIAKGIAKGMTAVLDGTMLQEGYEKKRVRLSNVLYEGWMKKIK